MSRSADALNLVLVKGQGVEDSKGLLNRRHLANFVTTVRIQWNDGSITIYKIENGRFVFISHNHQS